VDTEASVLLVRCQLFFVSSIVSLSFDLQAAPQKNNGQLTTDN
jgi:hypothetical protein